MLTIHEQLGEPFPVNRIHWRVGATTADKSKGIALAYIDARDVMGRLDSVVGPENWQCRYSHVTPNGVVCEIGIRAIVMKPQSYAINISTGEAQDIPSNLSVDDFIWKANGAGETQVEGEKGAMSDAFKRAAVMWNVGRYLYSLPNAWVRLENRRIVEPPKLPTWATPEGYRAILEKRHGNSD